MQKGKIIGGLLGFCFGGPLGGICGYLIGRSYDNQRQNDEVWIRKGSGADSFSAHEEQYAFAIGVIVLSAKMARADGKVSRAEVQAFREIFNIRTSRGEEVAAIFNQARLSPDGYEPYAMRLAQMFGDRPSVLEGILSSLLVIAVADSPLSEKEVEFLKAISSIFGFDSESLIRIAARSGVELPESERDSSPAPDPSFAVLGIAETATDSEIKAAYRTLIREHHPDRLMSLGVSAEYVAIATEKMKRINAAYDAICKQRGFS